MTRLLALALARLAARTVRSHTRGLCLLVAASAVAPGGCGALERAQPDAPPVARVVRVIDGDTIVARSDGGQLTVRLLGIDSPRRTAAPPSAAAARQASARADRVRLVTDQRSGDARDRYGRLLAHVDGRRGDLGERQLRAGLAYVYRYRGRRFSRVDRYRRAEDDARAHERATWSGCGGDFHSARPAASPDQRPDPIHTMTTNDPEPAGRRDGDPAHRPRHRPVNAAARVTIQRRGARQPNEEP